MQREVLHATDIAILWNVYSLILRRLLECRHTVIFLFSLICQLMNLLNEKLAIVKFSADNFVMIFVFSARRKFLAENSAEYTSSLYLCWGRGLEQGIPDWCVT